MNPNLKIITTSLLLMLACVIANAQYSITFVKDTEPTQCTGIIMVSVSEAETGPFTIEAILNGPSGETLVATKSAVSSIATFADLCEGSYTIRITDDFGCEHDLSAFVDGCDDIGLTFPPASYVTNSTNCNAPNGEVTIYQNVFTGGHGNITWEWSAGTIGLHGLVDLSPGTYTLTATDEVGCEGIFNFEVGGEELMVVGNPESTCEGQSIGSVYAWASFTTGGPSTYQWSNGATTEKIINLAAGSYTVTATHTGSGCEAIETFVVEEIPNASSFTIDGVMTNTCPNENNGSIVLSISGASGPVSYQWDCSNCFGAYVQELPAGTHTVVATDYCGNVASSSFEIETYEEPELQIIPYNDCNANGSGGLKIAQVGGDPDHYAFKLNGAHHTFFYPISNKVLTTGDYSLEIISPNGCDKIVDFRIESDAPGSAPLRILNDQSLEIDCSKGEVNPTIVGGNPPYSFLWKEYNAAAFEPVIATTQQVSNLPNKQYSLTVTDNCGNTDWQLFDLTCDCVPNFSLGTSLPCLGPHKIKILVSNGISNLANGHYSFKWIWGNNYEEEEAASLYVDEDHNLNWTNRNKTFLSGQNVRLNIKDPKGCDYNVQVYVDGYPAAEIVSIENGGPNTIGHLSNLYPSIFEFSESHYGYVQNGCCSWKFCGGFPSGHKDEGDLEFFTGAPNSTNPCSAGFIKCTVGDKEEILSVPQNSPATYFSDLGAGRCGCFFPKEIFPEENLQYPLFVEFMCDNFQTTSDTTVVPPVLPPVDTTLCNCENCTYPPSAVLDCGYEIFCLDTWETIGNVPYPESTWIECRKEECINGTDVCTITTYIYCPVDPCQRSFIATVPITENIDTTLLEYLYDLPVCPCDLNVLLDADDNFIPEELKVPDDLVKVIDRVSKDFMIYPNPTLNNELWIEMQANSTIIDMNVSFLDGRKLNTNWQRSSPDTYRLSVSDNRAAGIYFLIITLADGRILQEKIVLL